MKKKYLVTWAHQAYYTTSALIEAENKEEAERLAEDYQGETVTSYGASEALTEAEAAKHNKLMAEQEANKQLKLKGQK